MSKLATSKLEVLTPESARWHEFADALGDELEVHYCDGDAFQGGADKQHRHAKQVMVAMGGVDIDGSLAFFESKGGHCDCKIILNVDP